MHFSIAKEVAAIQWFDYAVRSSYQFIIIFFCYCLLFFLWHSSKNRRFLKSNDIQYIVRNFEDQFESREKKIPVWKTHISIKSSSTIKRWNVRLIFKRKPNWVLLWSGFNWNWIRVSCLLLSFFLRWPLSLPCSTVVVVFDFICDAFHFIVSVGKFRSIFDSNNEIMKHITNVNWEQSIQCGCCKSNEQTIFPFFIFRTRFIVRWVEKWVDSRSVHMLWLLKGRRGLDWWFM